MSNKFVVRHSLFIGLACLSGVLPLPSFAETDGNVRYVWASKLALRAGPDANSTEVARLPYGTKVSLLSESNQPLARRETVAKLRRSSEHPASEVTLDGYWRHVEAAGKDGWIFDGYLSRYPAPAGEKSRTAYDDEEMAYAAQVFGIAHEWQWKEGDGKESESYKIMRRKWTPAENTDAYEISWARVEFKLGGSAEISTILGNGSSCSLSFERVPLTFNESLLWWLHFHPFDGSGTFLPQYKLEAGPSDEDDSGIGYGRTIECDSQACNIRRDVID